MSLYNLDIERAVLSTVVFDPGSDDVARLLLSHDASLFFHPAHADIFTSLKRLHLAGKPIDEEFLRLDLVARSAFDEAVMLEVLAANPVANLAAYVHELEKMARARATTAVGTEIRKRIEEGGEDPDGVLSWAVRELDAAFSVGGEIVSRRAITEVGAREPEFRIANWLPLPKGSVSVVSAAGGSGKTWLTLQASVRAAMEDRSLRVFLWLTEDHEGIVRSRFDAICREIVTGADEEAMRRVEISTDAPLVLLERQRGAFAVSPKFWALKRELDGYGMIVIDPLLAFFGGDENDNGQARLFMQPWIDWARESGKTILFVHHSRKGGEAGPKSRGAGAFVDAVRVAYEMEKITRKREGRQVADPERLHLRKITLTKDNWGAFRHLYGFEFERHITPVRGAREVEVGYETIEMPTIT